ncbi:MAG: dipeptidyl aminopeptidase [Pseudomonadota bacterium]
MFSIRLRAYPGLSSVSRLVALIASIGLCLTCGFAGAQTAEQQRPEVIKLPLTIDGSVRQVVTHLYKPQGPGPFPLVIFSHGRAPHQADRDKLQYPVLVGHANYWLRKGVAVVAPIRPGYGETGGADRENSFTRWKDGTCLANPDFSKVGRSASDVVVAIHGWSLQQPWVRKDRILLEGQSVGGLTTVAASTLNLPGVIAAVNFSGGSGGAPDVSPTRSCKPENLTKTYAEFGRQVRVPGLWFYAENDQYWGAEAPREWYRAFKAAGSSDTDFIQTGPLPDHDGHALLNYGGRLWSVPLDAFVKKVGFVAR